jgi:hypothetical protein
MSSAEFASIGPALQLHHKDSSHFLSLQKEWKFQNSDIDALEKMYY